jgi:hypothetical protein
MAAIHQDFQELQTFKSQEPSLESAMKLMRSRGRGEFMGNTMILLMAPAIGKLQITADRCRQKQGNLHVAFALTAYQRDLGHYPAKLDQLCPKYIKEIPGDLFSGKALIYRLVDKGYLLYSVGPNGVNDDGQGYDDELRGDDLAIRMPVPAYQKKK